MGPRHRNLQEKPAPEPDGVSSVAGVVDVSEDEGRRTAQEVEDRAEVGETFRPRLLTRAARRSNHCRRRLSRRRRPHRRRCRRHRCCRPHHPPRRSRRTGQPAPRTELGAPGRACGLPGECGLGSLPASLPAAPQRTGDGAGAVLRGRAPPPGRARGSMGGYQRQCRPAFRHRAVRIEQERTKARSGR